MEEIVIVDLQSVIRGFLLRKELIQSVRREYEEFFVRVEGDSGGNVLTWSDNLTLCYPNIRAKVETEHHSTTVQTAECQLDTKTQEVTDTPIQDSVSNDNTKAQGPLCSYDDTNFYPLTIHGYPNDREDLLELREQMGLELIWVRQAIQSRVQYLDALSEMKNDQQ